MERRAQSVIEYSLVLAVVAAVFVAMQTYLKRSIQAGIRISADQLGNQEQGLEEVNAQKGVVETMNSQTTTPLSEVNKYVYQHVNVATRELHVDTSEIKQTTTTTRSERRDDGRYEN